MSHQPPTPKPGALTDASPRLLSCRARPAVGASIKKQIMATFVIATCYTDFRPGSELELLLGTFVITTCYADLHQNSDLKLVLATFCDHSLLGGFEARGTSK